MSELFALIGSFSCQISLMIAAASEWVDRFGSESRKGADILVQAIEREGVDTVFAYPGGASIEIHQALTRSGALRNVLCRHEQVIYSGYLDFFG